MTSENFSLDGNSLKLDSHIIYTPILTKGEPGEQGLKGEKGEKGDSLTYDRLTPNLRINLKGEPGDRGLQGLAGQKGSKGDKGDNGLTIIPHFTATATIDQSTDSPHVDVSVTGTDLNPILNFSFKGLRGINGAKGDKGDNGISPAPYDDSDLRVRIDELINAEEQRIKNLINNLDKEIKDDVKEMVKEAEFWQENLPEGIIGGNSNFGQDDVLEYLQQLGLWEVSDGTTYTKWSTIKLTIDSIRLEVRELLEHQSDEGEPINYESLSSSLYAYINNHQAESGLLSTWTKFLKLDNEEIQMLEWISAGVKSVASSLQAVSELFAAAKNSQTETEGYAGLNARVEAIEGSYVSTTSLTSVVNNAVSSSMSGLVTLATLDSAIATLNARIDNSSGGSSSAGLVTLATFDSAIAELSARIDSVDGTNMAGVITEANLDGAVAALFARSSNTKNAVGEYIGNGGSGSDDGIYAGLQLRVQNIENDYITSADLSSRVNESVSGLFTENSSNDAVALLYARVSNNEDEIASIKASAGPGGTQIDLTADQINAVTKTADILVGSLEINGGRIIFTQDGHNSIGIGGGWISSVNVDTGTVYSSDNLDLYAGDDIIIGSGNSGNLYLGKSGSVYNPWGSLSSMNSFSNIYLNGSNIILGGNVSSSNDITANRIITNRVLDPSTGNSYITFNGNSGGTLSLNANVVVANGNVISSSDECLKNVILNIDNVYVEQIANVRTVNYEFKNRPGVIKTGTIALDWQHILPNTVTPIDNEYHLGLDYSAAALISSVVDAREIVKLKQENEELKQRLAAIEEKLA